MLTRTYHADNLARIVEVLDAAQVPGLADSDAKQVTVTVLHEEDLAEAIAVSMAREAEMQALEERRKNLVRILSVLVRRVTERTLGEPVRVTRDELNDILGWELKMGNDEKDPTQFFLRVEAPKDRILVPRLLS